MSRAIKLQGYFGGEYDKPQPVEVTAVISGSGMGEILTLDCQGGYRVSVPYRPIAQLAREAVQIARQEKNVEPYIELEGQDSNLRRGKVAAYLRVRGNFLMLSLDFMNMGQISAPFAPIEKMVRTERGMFA